MARNKVDDPFEDDWGMPGEGDSETSEMPESEEGRFPFLKPHHLKQNSGTIELVMVTSETSEYSDVVLLVKANGRQYRLGLKLFSDEYKALKKRFGNKRSDWHGDLRYRIMPHGGRERGFVAVR